MNIILLSELREENEKPFFLANIGEALFLTVLELQTFIFLVCLKILLNMYKMEEGS